MSIYTCPHCGKKSFNPIKKAFAGQLNSRGKVCMECGRRCVNGRGATIFNAVFSTICFAFIVLKTAGTAYDWIDKYEWYINFGLVISYMIIPKLVNAFFFRLEPAIRSEY